MDFQPERADFASLQWMLLGLASLTLSACVGETGPGSEGLVLVDRDTDSPAPVDAGMPPPEDGRETQKDGSEPDDCPTDNQCDSPGARRCDGSTIVECVEDDEGCASWESVSTCGADETCQEGSCQRNCTDQCSEDTSRCAGDTIETCGHHDGDSCLEWGEETTCPGSEICSDGACIANCDDQCSPGETRCFNDRLETCDQHDDDSCVEWGGVRDCSAGQTCSDGTCVPDCSNACSSGATRCSGDAVQTCDDHDADGCREWGGDSLCPLEETCSGGSCVNECNSQCSTIGETRCSGGDVQTCNAHDDDSCLEWGGDSACSTGETCSGGSCVPDCSDQCPSSGQTRCSGDDVQTCGNHDSDSCLEWDGGLACGAGETCTSGSCVPDCSDQCSNSGQTRCSGDDVQTCGNHDSDSCLEWDGGSACGAGKTCSDGACVSTCSDECSSSGQIQCDGFGKQTCGDHDGDSCLEWHTTYCPSGERCQSGACTTTSQPHQLVISEIVYDTPGADDDTFVEIHGPANTDITGYELVGVNGYNGNVYDSVLLRGSTNADGLFVIAHDEASSSMKSNAQQLAPEADFQNGPDNVQIRWGSSVVDALGYGDFKNATFAGEGTPHPDADPGESLARYDSARDTDDNLADFYTSSSPSPADLNSKSDPCQDGDGNCPSTCNSLVDDDCSPDCGNHLVESGEECDDGNQQNGDGCTSSCQVPPGDTKRSLNFGDTGHSSDRIRVVEIGPSGARYVGGQFTDSIDIGSTTHNGSSTQDAFLAKFDAAGTLQWVESWGGTGQNQSDRVSGLAVDASGNVYAAGGFQGEITLGGTSHHYSSTITFDMFLVKFDAAGNHQWTTTRKAIEATDLTRDSSGSLYVTGNHGPQAPGLNSTYTDYYVGKYDAAGAHQWSQSPAYSDGSEYGRAIAVSSSGTVFVTGSYDDQWRESSTSFVDHEGDSDAFLVAYDSSGNYDWHQTFGDTDTDIGNDIAVDSAGEVYVTGTFRGAIQYGGGQSMGGTFRTRPQMFVIKYGSLGTVRWGSKIGSQKTDAYGKALAVDASNDVYLAADYQDDQLDFGGSALPHPLGNYREIAVAKWDSSGNHLWSRKFGDDDFEYVHALAVESPDDLAVAGKFGGTVDFGDQTLDASGGEDLFLLSLHP